MRQPVLTTTIRKTKKSMQWWSRKSVYQIFIVIILTCLTIHTNWTFFHQQMSSIIIPITDYNNFNNGIDGTSSSTIAKDNKKNNKNDIVWEWKRYSIDTNSTSTSTSTSANRTVPMLSKNETYNKKRILIAQYDAGWNVSNNNSNNNSTYSIIMNITSHINQLYAYQYQLDYVLLRGIVFRTFYERVVSSSRTTILLPSSRSTYNKVYIIEKAIELNYDYLLLLDSDAMIYDFNRTILQLLLLLPSTKMIVAHQVVSNNNHNNNNHNNQEEEKQYNINIGVTIWNIHHPMIHIIVTVWKLLCYYRILFQLHDNDQKPLQTILRYYHRITTTKLFLLFSRQSTTFNTSIIEQNYIDFAYRHGTFVKHFLRHNSNVWSSQQSSSQQQPQIDDTKNRINEIASVATEICIQYNLQMCNNYSTFIQ